MLYQPLESTGLRVAGKQNNSIYKIKARAEERGKVSFGVTTTSLIPQELNPKKKKRQKNRKKNQQNSIKQRGQAAQLHTQNINQPWPYSHLDVEAATSISKPNLKLF